MNTWRIAHSESSLGWGGQEMRVMTELLGFKRRGGTVFLIAPPQSRIYARALEENIPVFALDARKSRYPLTALRISRWLRENKVEVLNTHSSRDGWVVAIAGRFAKTPLIIRSRHIDVGYSNPFVSRHAFTTLADHVITTSDKISGKLQSIFGLARDRVDTITTGIDIERFHPEGPAADLFEDGNPEALPLVGMVSVLRSWKGHPDFIGAMQLLQGEGVAARYAIVGEGPQRPNLEAALAALPANISVTLAGHRDDVPEVLRSLDVLLIPSTNHEGVPQVGLQALACKTAVVGTSVGGIPEIIRDGETGRIVPPENARALADAIRAALEEKEATAAMAERGREAVVRSHSIDHMLDELDTLYRRYLGDRS